MPSPRFRPYRRTTAALLLAIGALSACISGALAADFVQSEGSALTFSGSYQGEAFHGQFPGFQTRFRFDPADLGNARLDVTIPVAKATTKNDDYDGELRGSAFFDSAAFPQARYVATRFRALGDNRYAADGTLTLRGIGKPVTFTFTWTPGANPTLVGGAVVKRLDFEVGGGDWADTTLIPNEIKVGTKVVFKAQTAAPQTDAP